MKSRLPLVSAAAALVVLLVAMTWVVRDRRSCVASTVATAAVPATTPSTTFSQAKPVTAAPPASQPVLTPEAKAAPMVRIAPSGAVGYVARAGDTISEVTIALLGSDSEDHRDAVSAANVSFQRDPDRVVAGRVYSIDTSPGESGADHRPADVAVTDARTAGDAAAAPAKPASAGPRLRYIARRGDTVAVLAGNLLGGDTAENRRAIIAANESLRAYPNHLVAGETYTILVPDGMTSDPAAPQSKATGSELDADEAVQQGSGRTLRYTAEAGDTVSKLAVALLGSDTPANQALIVQSNPSLKRDPDHLVAGQTYWISAPDAE